MFVINRSGGRWDDSYTQSLFVTQSEEFAKEYCDKANKVFQKIKIRFSEIDSELDSIEDENPKRNLLLSWWCKYESLSNVNRHYYEPIEVRNGR
jgi:hypothetical protein